MNELLTNREISILHSIIQTFISKAAPVGSRFISKEFQFSISPATIRNVMMDLEVRGFITQPHTSAGRIPTNKGYRYYVDGLMKLEDLPIKEKKFIEQDLLNVSQEDVEEILNKSCQALCKVSHLLGVVLSPRFFLGRFKKLELVKLSDNHLLVIISIEAGLVKTITLEIQNDISKDRLDETSRIINERLQDLTLQEIRDNIGSRMKDVSIGDEGIIQQVVDSADKIFINEDIHIHFGGMRNILKQPEFKDSEKGENILDLIDNQKTLIQVLNEQEANENITIIIGEENKNKQMQDCSLITTQYKIGSTTGTLGVIGPTRMNYSKVVSLVDYLAREMSYIFNK